MSERFALLDSVPLGAMVLDRDLRVLFWNASLEEWTGLRRQEVLGRDVRERLPQLWQQRYATRLAGLFESGAPAVFSSQLHPHLVPAPLRSGRLRVQHTTAVAIPAPEGGYQALLTLEDVTPLTDASSALRRARDEARQRASVDALTGVDSRAHFLEGAARALSQARRHRRELSLLMLDIDRFKAVNDGYGHAAGDATLVTLARICSRTLRDGDAIGRLGGDEFAVLLPEAPRTAASQVADRLRHALAASGVEWEGRRLPLEVSVGVATMGAEDEHIDALLHRADEALYEAKREGRNRVVAR
ncbi:MAG TPA: diguanylate cyclase [Vicinamibacteria bacterium]|nr:diguanylate cyclase [Vicinamibacteria bacterium]